MPLDLVLVRETYPQIPVDLMAIVTSPGWRPFPVCASSTFGVALSSHRL